MDQTHPLDRLFAVIQSRQGADPASSYTAKLFSQGTLKIATCYLNAYQETGTAQTVCFSGSGCTANLAGVNFSAAPNLLASCGTYEPSSTASTLTLPANAAMVAETCNITAIGQ